MKNIYSHRLYLGPHSPLSVPFSRLIKGNASLLREIQTEYPPNGLHRETLSKLLKLPENTLADTRTHEIYVDAMLKKDSTRGIIYNYDAFLGSRKSALKNMAIYPSLEKKISPLRLLTKAQKATVFLCLQSYTDLIEQELAGAPKLQRALVASRESSRFSWVPFVLRLRAAWPEANIVIIEAGKLAIDWAAIVALVTGHPKSHLFRRINDFPLKQIHEFGVDPFKATLAANPPENIGDWLKLSSKLFNDYGFSDPYEDDGPGSIWTLEQSQHSKRCFADDVETLRKMEDILVASDLVKDFR